MQGLSTMAMPARVAAKLSPLAEAILQVISRTEEILREEEIVLSRSSFAEIETLATRKNHLALELGRLIGHASQSIAGETVVMEALSRLNGSLANNAKLLRLHIEATNEISTILANAIASASADGIYTSDFKSAGRKSWSR